MKNKHPIWTKLDEENARGDAAEEEERKQLEQEAALKLELRKKA